MDRTFKHYQPQPLTINHGLDFLCSHPGVGTCAHPTPVTDFDINLIITGGLPTVFTPVISTLDSLPFNKVTLPNIIACVMGHEAHILHMVETKDENLTKALAVMHRKREPKKENQRCYNCGGRGHIHPECPSQLFESPHANLMT
jgi:hypothetical protein